MALRAAAGQDAPHPLPLGSGQGPSDTCPGCWSLSSAPVRPPTLPLLFRGDTYLAVALRAAQGWSGTHKPKVRVQGSRRPQSHRLTPAEQ